MVKVLSHWHCIVTSPLHYVHIFCWNWKFPQLSPYISWNSACRCLLGSNFDCSNVISCLKRITTILSQFPNQFIYNCWLSNWNSSYMISDSLSKERVNELNIPSPYARANSICHQHILILSYVSAFIYAIYYLPILGSHLSFHILTLWQTTFWVIFCLIYMYFLDRTHICTLILYCMSIAAQLNERVGNFMLL